MKTLAIRGLAAVSCLISCGSRADAEIIQYLVEFAQSGDVMVGSTLDWTLSVVVSDSTAGTNFGIQTATVDLVNSTDEVMAPGTVSMPFSDYTVLPPSPPPQMIGTPGADGELTDISAALLFYDAGAVEGEHGDLGPIVLATGSYQVNTLGMHTLSTREALSESLFYNIMDGSTTAEYDAISTGIGGGVEDGVMGTFDTVNVIVPEPASMLLTSVLIVPGVIGVRRRRQQRRAELAA